MGLFDKLFGKNFTRNRVTSWSEYGSYRALFTNFGNDIYMSELVRSCVRPISELTSKANVVSNDKRIQKILELRPNMYMNGAEFLKKARTILEVTNNLFILLVRDDTGKVIEYYPVPYVAYEGLNYKDELYINFKFANSTRKLVASWKDLAVIRKDYFRSDISGENNLCLVNTLDLVNTSNQGITNAVKSTSNLRGIIKTSKANLKREDIKTMKEDFVKDYMGIQNEGGIAALDASMEFTPVKMEPVSVNAAQMKEFREDVYRFFGVNDAIIMADYTEDQMLAFYESRIEPFLVSLSEELTSKTFSAAEQSRGKFITFAGDKLQFASLTAKLNLVSMVDRGALTPNEWRQALNLSPIEGGDKPIRRLDTAEVDNTINESEENNDKE